MIHRSPFADIEIPTSTISEFVFRHTERLAHRAAVIDGPRDLAFTYAELAGRARRFAGTLVDLGVGPGDVVAVMLPTSPEFAIVFHGIVLAGATVTTVNPNWKVHEVAHQLRDAGAVVLVTVASQITAGRVATSSSNVTEVLTIDLELGSNSLDELLGDPIDQVRVDAREAVAVIPYSSGTTGLPKGVMLTHRNLVANLAMCEPVLDYAEREVALAALPFFHIYGMQMLMNGLLAAGATVVTMPRFDLHAALTLVQRRRVTRLFAVPPIVLAIAKDPAVAHFDVSSLRQVFSGAAPLGADLAAEASRRLGCPVVQGYGMTELSPVSHAAPSVGAQPGSVGVTVPNAECRIVDLSGDDVGEGAEGELLVRGEHVMKGYLGNPDATAAIIDSAGWLHTGDVGRFDNGHLYIVDRIKELIKVNGFQVAPAELEALLLTHSTVVDAAVIGVPDETAGERVKAFVVRVSGAATTTTDIEKFVSASVATYKRLSEVEFVDSIPRSPSGKILRRTLRNSS